MAGNKVDGLCCNPLWWSGLCQPCHWLLHDESARKSESFSGFIGSRVLLKDSYKTGYLANREKVTKQFNPSNFFASGNTGALTSLHTVKK
ncbi:hypothetical protein L1049_011393 [Liquidambar formosana]|uniref:Uncharacterized protein n=1 Tax=Liquidambar formosana TaxID=63359 RepID=A0AAP0RRH4_LIQFO